MTDDTMTELYTRTGEKASLYDVCRWWIATYPADIYTGESGEESVLCLVRIREQAEKILEKATNGVSK